ncbi:inorganic phosphate transporter [Rhizobium oryzicola]|uniref:Phosphate transporter n=1 Tax=Rhizobium oryzicola TaxID=1232668 RepID=A0ABT8SRU5_9HYPH|nr:inorganic phosphate transporter [Rhizobium oryzicola]MDO1581140.1 anion permease [Rhizobium oryzicola]
MDRITSAEEAAKHLGTSLAAPGAAFLFLIAVMMFAAAYVIGKPAAVVAIAAAVLAAYMAMNIGANDVTNHIGAAVGARAFTLAFGLGLSAVCEIAGALIAGSDVADTIANGILHVEHLARPGYFIWAMMAALLGAAVWINVATWLNAPISTTHSIVGGVMGAGLAAAGLQGINWPVIGGITISWLISPIMGAAIAVAILAIIDRYVIYTSDKIAAACRWVPVLIGTMFGAFSTYILLKVAAPYYDISFSMALMAGCFGGIVVWALSVPIIRRQSFGLENRNQSLRKLFQLPLIFSAALLAFAHGANDVANAVGPLAAIVGALDHGPSIDRVAIPTWELLIGGFGISLGLLLYGPKLVKLVGKDITKLNPVRAYCVALSAAVTVIVASSVGAPVSSTHIAVGSVFGVGLYREWHTRHSRQRAQYLAMRAEEKENLGRKKRGKKSANQPIEINQDEVRRRYLVRRSHLLTILGAWTITVPISAALAAVLAMIMFRLFI